MLEKVPDKIIYLTFRIPRGTWDPLFRSLITFQKRTR